MANLIDISFFFGELNVAQKTESAGSLGIFIDEMEPRLLTDLLGYELYKAYTTGIAAVTPDAKWLAIRDGKEYTNRSGHLTYWDGLIFTKGTAKKSLIANFVYWHWMADQSTVTTGTGEKASAAANAVDVSPARKMVRAWNQMVKWNCEFVEFLLSNPTDYPEFQNYYGRIPADLLKYQNTFGI